ncbi:hypothetical protein [Metabacillus halosaccharovorans]|uniref:hypothetical protein n=1 Tax=Metabacillus halosaccharovorans TaxID=930124 RepID=UPI001C1FC9D7|nr:hypothetical protein [Metabacillus halosaccharovorans]MBU7594535.1 hypothetical protein [Metabacillus halosaccharovorans]
MKHKYIIGLFTIILTLTAVGCSNDKDKAIQSEESTEMQKEVQDLKLENSKLKAENEKLKKKIELLQESK